MECRSMIRKIMQTLDRITSFLSECIQPCMVLPYKGGLFAPGSSLLNFTPHTSCSLGTELVASEDPLC
eukprot:5866855-Amphidinium_carterae.1